MMKKIVVFLLYPTVSHYVISFDLANDLSRRGSRVIFAGPRNKKLETVVADNGFEYSVISLFREYIIKGLTGIVSATFYNLLYNDLKIKLYKSFLNTDRDIARLIRQYKPTSFVIDDLMPFYGFLSRKNNVKFIFINTKHSGYMRLNTAPISSSRFGLDSDNKLLNYLDWGADVLRRKLMEAIKKIYLGGFTLYGIMRIQSNRYGNYFDRSDLTYKYSFNVMIRDAPILVLGNKYLEYPWVKLRPYEHYVQYKSIITGNKNLIDQSYFSFLSHLKEVRSHEENRPVIYISFGLLSREGMGNDYLDICQKAIGSALAVSNAIVVVSISEEFHPKIRETFDSTDLNVFSFVPQVEMLSHCNLMINHGGLNSIQECLFNDIPILSCPINKSAEHYTNSAKVAHHGIGRSVNIRKISEDDLVKVIYDLLLNKSYASKLTSINSLIDAELEGNSIDNENILDRYFFNAEI